MKIKSTSYMKILPLCIVLAGCMVHTAQAEDAFNRLIVRWKTERMGLLRSITCHWLRGDDPRGVQHDLFALSRIESGLATRPGTKLYISEIATPEDPDSGAGDVARAYLQNRHLLVNTVDLFRNKSFSLTRDVVIPPAEKMPEPTFTRAQPEVKPIQSSEHVDKESSNVEDPYQTRYVRIAK